MKYGQLLLSAIVIGPASAFAPPAAIGIRRASMSLSMSDEAPSAKSSSAIVAINEETVEFTAGILGGVVGFALGGPVLGAIGAAAANYASKTDAEVGELLAKLESADLGSLDAYQKVGG